MLHVASILYFRDVFRLAISNYQQWFQEALVFWIQTFRSECMSRIGKALVIDKDVSQYFFLFIMYSQLL
jgi:hypothetical protein